MTSLKNQTMSQYSKLVAQKMENKVGVRFKIIANDKKKTNLFKYSDVVMIVDFLCNVSRKSQP